MAELDTTARRWGDSIAVILPREIVQSEHIKPNDPVHIIVRKEHDLTNLFGRFKTKKTPQQLKDESRTAWQ